MSKIADRPHYVSIVLSVVAIIISCFSWWESHQSRRINEESNRPVLSLASIQPLLVTLPDDRRDRINLHVRFKNAGKVTLTIIEASVLPTLKNAQGSCQLYSIDMAQDSLVRHRETLDIPPGIDEGLSREIQVGNSCDLVIFEIAISVRYVDPNGKEFTQDFYSPLSFSLEELRKARSQPMSQSKHFP